jgi:predicted AlkP superfamily pyrophosphatase or phosphodiesterase
MQNVRLKSSKILLALVLAVAVPSCTQSKAVVSLRPTVILVSIDGFRYDFLDRYQPPNLVALAREGVRARWMIPCFPTKTFPNHYAIATGLYPGDNGIVENTIYDPATKSLFTMSDRSAVQTGTWWLGEPIWITAEKQGQKTAPYFWPGSEDEIAGKRPTYWMPYDWKIHNDERVGMILSRLDMPADDRPTFLTLYFSDVDHAAHEFGPDSAEARSAVLSVDTSIGKLIDGLKTRGMFDQVNVIIVSDHGMAVEDPRQTIVLDELFDKNSAEKILWTPEIVSIFPRPGKEQAIFEALKSKLPGHAKVYHKADLPARMHYSNSPRIAPLIVLPDEGWTLTSREGLAEWKVSGRMSRIGGGHGYDNQLQTMRAIFIAHGPALKRGITIEPFENIQIYDLITRILGLEPAPNDGNGSLPAAILSDRATGR